MRNFLCALAVLLVSVLAVSCGSRQQTGPPQGIVTRVSDGDTIQVMTGMGETLKVRLFGIDAPETAKGKRPGMAYGKEAGQALRGKVLGRNVLLDVRDRDQYGRTVAIVMLSERNINLEMVREGWAWAYTQYLDRPHASEFLDAERLARTEKRGFWKQRKPTPPWEWRKRKKAEES